LVTAKRQRTIEETDKKDDDDTMVDEDPDITGVNMKGPSSEALGKMTNYRELLNGF